MTRLLRIGAMVWIWLTLWGEVSLANVVSGLLVAGLLTASFDTWHRTTLIVRPVAVARFAVWFAYKMLEATFAVVRTVLMPSRRVHTGIVAVPLTGCSDAVATVIADCITLTPGTLTLEVGRDPLVLYVHALDARDLDSIRRDIRTLEVLAVRAFGSSEAQAGLLIDDTTASWEAP